MIENTSQTHGIADLPIFGGSSRAIEDMEAAGQQQLVNSDRLPVDAGGTDADFLALGFTFGQPDPGDPLFRPATLPAGWKRAGTDHSMWSKLVDEHGRERVSIFYKAAFYDRSAHMYLVTPTGYLNNALYHKTKPVLDEKWLTATVADETLVVIRDARLREAAEAIEFAARGDKGGYWTGRAADHRAEAEAAEAMRRTLAEATA